MTNREPVLQKKKLEQSDEPPKYAVVFHNDDYTPMDFVIELAMKVLNLSERDAEQITWAIHTAGKKAVGAYSKEVAESKSQQCNQVARANQHPLLTDIAKVK